MVGIAVGEAKNAAKIMPKVDDPTFWRISLSYVGSVILHTMVLSHWILTNRAKKRLVERPAFRLPFAPIPHIITISFLVIVIIGMWFSDDIGKATTLTLCGFCVVSVIGWYGVRNRIDGSMLDKAFADDTFGGDAPAAAVLDENPPEETK